MSALRRMLKKISQYALESVHWCVGIVITVIGIVGLFLPFIPGVLLITLGVSFFGWVSIKRFSILFHNYFKHKNR